MGKVGVVMFQSNNLRSHQVKNHKKTTPLLPPPATSL